MTMEGIGTKETNSRQVLSLLEKIKSSKGRKLNKLGELLNKGGKTPYLFDEKDLKYILR